MKYLIEGGNERIPGCLLFGTAAWKAEDRDRWIGWSPSVRQRNLKLTSSNTRLLILPWVRVPHLASYVLGACLRKLPNDWRIVEKTIAELDETLMKLRAGFEELRLAVSEKRQPLGFEEIFESEVRFIINASVPFLFIGVSFMDSTPVDAGKNSCVKGGPKGF